MSKILQAGECGFGIIIEYDAGYVNSDLNPTFINESFELKPNEPVLVNCILQKWGVKNKNGRIYPKDVLVPQVQIYQQLVDTNSAVSEADHPECVCASESMICTKDGWKWFKDIKDDEEILTLNPTTNNIEIQKIEKKIYLDYKGKMYKFHSRNSLDITVTGNHMFLLENSKGIRNKYSAKDICDNKDGILSSSKYKILKTGEWTGEYNKYFTLAGVDRTSLSFNMKHDLIDRYTESIDIASEDWFAFMGIYLAEGHCTGTKSDQYKLNGYNVIITQKNEEKKPLIEELLDRLPFKYYTHDNDGTCQYNINDARLYDYLFKLGHSHIKYVPIELKSASIDLLKILFHWFKMGDGRSVKSKHETWSNKDRVFSTSEKLIDDLHEILIKIGGSGNITTYQPKDRYLTDRKRVKNEKILSDGSIEYSDGYTCTKRLVKAENSVLQYNLNISKTKHIYLDKRFVTITEIDFDDTIACVRVPNGNFLVRVNGKSHWTGNSSIISLQNISHMITKMWWGKNEYENVLYGQLKIIVSPGYIKYGVVSVVGDKIVLYLQNKIKMGISSRGVGTLKEINGENLVQGDFELIGFDLVTTPSTPGGYLFSPDSGSQTFGETYVNKNGIYLKEDEKKIIAATDRFLL